MSAGHSPDLTTPTSGLTSRLLVGDGFPLALLATILVEGVIVLAHTAARGLRIRRWLTFVTLINLITQPALWCVMGLLPADIPYFPVLAIGESLVWLTEAVLLHVLAGGRLTPREAAIASLVLNGVSVGIGLLLPV